MSLRNSFSFTLLALALTACGSAPTSTTTTTPPPQTADQRAAALVAQMSETQQLQMVEGGTANDSLPTTSPSLAAEPATFPAFLPSTFLGSISRMAA